MSGQTSLGLLIVRAGFGALMAYFHGWPHLMGGPNVWKGLGEAVGVLGIHAIPEVFGFLAAVSESIGAVFLVLGLWTRFSAFFLFCTMLVAVLMHHLGGHGDPIPALQYGLVFLALIFTGPGKFSVDASYHAI